MAIYMKVPFTQGSVTAKGYKGWINIQSMQLEADRSLAFGGNVPREKRGVPKFSPITIVKAIDEASPGLVREALMGSGGSVEIAVVEPTTDAPREYVRYTLTGALLTSYLVSSASSAGERPVETFTLTYGFIEMRFTAHNALGAATTADSVSYDLEVNQAR